MDQRKTLREVRDFLNQIEDKYLDRRFVLQQEDELHYVNSMEINTKDLYYDPDDPESGSMAIEEWKENSPEIDISTLELGIPKGCPLIGEDY